MPPNIVLILLDDAGFADTSTFGGFAQTPELQRLAQVGIRYNSFHTAGLCAPTRAALLSGRNHHRVGFGGLPPLASNLPGYNCIWPDSAAAIPKVLGLNGYATAAFGKWHNTPYCDNNPVGPFRRWPTGLGFDYFYGFQEASENEWEPSSLYRNTTPVEIVAGAKHGYHLTSDVVDDAIKWLHTVESLASNRPYFLYLATGAVHAPHQVAKVWSERYRGMFDRGWDILRDEVFERQKACGVIPREVKLTPRPEEIPAWTTLSSNEKRLFSRQMEVYAGFVSHTDYEVGRLVEAVQRTSRADNTVILYIAGDNGSAGEAGVTGISCTTTSVEKQLRYLDDLGGARVAFNMYATGWAWMGNTPFKWWKAVASHFGGVRAPMIVSWPTGIKDKDSLRTQFTHVTDVAPTLYEIAGVSLPNAVEGVAQLELDGVSFAYTFTSPHARCRHKIQYFETYGNRAIYNDGWIAAAPHWTTTWQHPTSRDPTEDRWELYNVEEDFSEANDLVDKHPVRLQELKRLFDREAERNNVLPLAASFGPAINPSLRSPEKEHFRYQGDIPRLQFGAMPPLLGRSYRLIVAAVIPKGGVKGVIVSYGGRGGGFVLYAIDRRIVYEHNSGDGSRKIITGDEQLPSGKVEVRFDFTKQEDVEIESSWPAGKRALGVGRLSVNGRTVGVLPLEGVFGIGVGESFGIGRAYGSPVTDAFRPPFAFTGAIELVTVEVD